MLSYVSGRQAAVEYEVVPWDAVYPLSAKNRPLLEAPPLPRADDDDRVVRITPRHRPTARDRRAQHLLSLLPATYRELERQGICAASLLREALAQLVKDGRAMKRPWYGLQVRYERVGESSPEVPPPGPALGVAILETRQQQMLAALPASKATLLQLCGIRNTAFHAAMEPLVQRGQVRRVREGTQVTYYRVTAHALA